jgi:hypothetical protein
MNGMTGEGQIAGKEGFEMICKRRISSRDEVHEKNIRIHWDRLQNKYTNSKGVKITPISDKVLEYKSNLIQHVNRMPRNRLPRIMKHYFPTGRRNHGRPLKRLLDT